jgi:hypothetical protein
MMRRFDFAIGILLLILVVANVAVAFSPSLKQTQYKQNERIKIQRESSLVGQTSTQLFIASDVIANGEAAKVKKSREVSGLRSIFTNYLLLSYLTVMF